MMIQSAVAAGIPYLGDYVREDYAAAKGLEPSSLRQVLISVKLLERFAGQKLRLDQVPAPLFNAFLGGLEKLGRRPATVRSKRKDLLAVLRQAAEDELIPGAPKVRRVKVPHQVRPAWTQEEVAAIVARAEAHPRGAVLVTALRLCWDTDCRISAVYNAAPAAYDPRRRGVTLLEPKSGELDFYPLTPLAIAAIEALPKGRRRLCGAEVRLRRLREWLTDVLRGADFAHDAKSKFHRVRRSKYTAVAAKYGIPAAAKHARHKSAAMAKYYLDPAILPDAEVVHGLSL